MDNVLRFFCSMFLGMASASAINAQSYFPSGSCAVVVAARPSVEEARTYISANGWQETARVFESTNGWFAITAGVILNEFADDAIESLKADGAVPDDAYCSSGWSYIREVAWRTENRSPDRPISTGLWDDFDARPLSQTEKRFLQAALAMAGYYTGLLDGVWGNRSQMALERYTAAEFDGVEPLNAHAAYLSSIMLGRWIDEGWDYKNISYLAISMMLPVQNLTLVEETGLYQEWHHTSKNLKVLFNDLDSVDLRRLHEDVVSDLNPRMEPYTLRSADTWVTSLLDQNDTIYVRSDLIAGTWSTVVIFAGADLQAEVGLIAASIRPGRPPEIIPSMQGRLTSLADELADSIRGSIGQSPPEAGAALPVQPGERPRGTTSGTAFYVTANGVALTNAHVIEGCEAITLDGMPAEILAQSSVFDLAALRLETSVETEPLPFATGDAGLNADITIAGYPLHGLLGGLNVGRGSVSSLKGLQGDETSIQISAPVQPGNSGGPAIDRFGGVVGVVVSKLDTVRLADEIGDIAQNVNFAIRGSIAKIFLSSNGIAYLDASQAQPLAPEQSAQLLAKSTRLVECD
ncbi:trypsin-like peptidase domain-containing protein [Lacimonas salitolerans]|uniref:Trypsin-like peptidase domain-containing protein n=1 Tax=Lacimonas salitolerans TaxID=1323750 RepID=A0ABW4EKV7_9RHOB